MAKKKFRLIATITILLMGGFMTTSFVSYFVAHESLNQQISENTLPLTSDNIYSEIQRDLLRPTFISSLMAQDTFVRDWTLAGEEGESRIIRYLTSIQERYGTVTSYFVSDKTYRYYHPKGILKTVNPDDPQDRWYFRVRDMQNEFEINVDTDTADLSSLTVFINYKVFGYSNDYLGAIGVGLAVNAVKELVNNYEHRYGRTIFFTDLDGNVTLHGAGYRGGRSLAARPGMDAIASEILDFKGGSFTYERNGETVFLNSRFVPEFNWLLFVEQTQEQAEQRILNTLLINLAIAGVISVIVLLMANITISSYQRRLEEMATKDALTGVMGRQVFDEVLERAIAINNRRNGRLSLVICDIDDFKKINDLHGHLAGDEVLRAVADSMERTVRQSDVLCRWGGEEFLILLEGCDISQAESLAEKVLAGLRQLHFTFETGEATVSASFGVAELIQGETERDFINRADQAMFEAKAKGKNRVETA